MRFFARSSDFENPSSPLSPSQNPAPKTASAALKSISPLTNPKLTTTKPVLSILPTYPITATSPRKASRNDGENSSFLAQAQGLASSPLLTQGKEWTHTSEKSRKLLEVYDPKVGGADEVLSGKEMVRRRVVEDFVWCAVRLQRHEWVLSAGSEMYGELKTVERWELIHADLERYVKALAAYEHFLSQDPKTHLLDLNSPTTWAKIHRLGRTLAILECATYHTEFDHSLQELTRSLSSSITTVCTSNSKPKKPPYAIQERRSSSSQFSQTRSTNIVPSSIVATLAGCALIVPVLLILLGSEMVCSLFTTSTFAMAVGLVLIFYMKDGAGRRDDAGGVVAVFLGIWMVLQAFEFGVGVSA